ncbi:MAG: radical SAM protein [Planctomycetes bacterium]|nr:radical SAM protein [Planctomycetota bacterium]
MRGLSLLRTIGSHQRSDGERRPRLLTHTVTFKCNARCVMCDSWRLSGKGDLTLDEVDAVYAQLPRLDAVRLTGGEPFVRADFAELVELAQRRLRPLQLHVTTNGFLTDAVVAFCEQRTRTQPLDLLVSLDGVGATHDRIRGRAGAWTATYETLRRLAPRAGELGLRLRVNQTIVDAEGLDAYRELRAALAPLGLRPQVVLAYAESAMYSTERDLDLVPDDASGYEAFGDLEERDLRALLDLVEADLDALPFLDRQAKRYYLRGLRARALGEGPRLAPPCVALHSHLRLLPNGDVPTCQFSTKVVGNLREASFDSVWTSLRAEERRAFVRACPGCWAECEVLPSAVYSGDLFLHRLRKRAGSRPEAAYLT